MEANKISVIVPVYNAEKYLEKCVESILNQTYSNFELLLINDGSVDNSSKVCHSFETDCRVKVYDKENEDSANNQLAMGGLSDWTRNPEELMIDQENLTSMEEEISRKLSRFEKEVLNLYLSGMNYSQIAETLGKGSKTTDNALQRIRKKIKNFVDMRE